MGSRYFRGLFLVTFQMSRFRSPRSALTSEKLSLTSEAITPKHNQDSNFKTLLAHVIIKPNAQRYASRVAIIKVNYQIRSGSSADRTNACQCRKCRRKHKQLLSGTRIKMRHYSNALQQALSCDTIRNSFYVCKTMYCMQRNRTLVLRAKAKI